MAASRARREPPGSSTAVLPPDVILRCSNDERDTAKAVSNAGELELWRELVQCVLSSNVRWELAQELTERLEESGLLEAMMRRPSEDVPSAVQAALSGECSEAHETGQSHRYPNRSAELLLGAADEVYGGYPQRPLSERLREADKVEEARGQLMEIPGVGMKQSSLFLRRVGFSEEVLVVDRHILLFCEGVLGWSVPRMSGRAYLELEDRFRELAASRGIPVGRLDEAVWEYMRDRQ